MGENCVVFFNLKQAELKWPERPSRSRCQQRFFDQQKIVKNNTKRKDLEISCLSQNARQY